MQIKVIFELAKPGGRSFLTATLRAAKVACDSKHLWRAGMRALPITGRRVKLRPRSLSSARSLAHRLRRLSTLKHKDHA